MIKECFVWDGEYDGENKLLRKPTLAELKEIIDAQTAPTELEQRVASLEEWRNRTIWGFQAQALQGKPIEAMTVWELIYWASQAYNEHGNIVDIRFREQAVQEIERRIREHHDL